MLRTVIETWILQLFRKTLPVILLDISSCTYRYAKFIARAIATL